MAIDLSTAGVTVQYAAETTAGTKPTTGYTKIPGIKAIPDLNPEPSGLDTTTLEAEEWKTYIQGLKDPGGAIQFTANNTEEFQTAWATLVEAYNTAMAADKEVWFAVVIPGLTKSFYFSGKPSDLGLSAIEVDAVLEIQPYITPHQIGGWSAKPTMGG
jgi:hypothetical protein